MERRSLLILLLLCLPALWGCAGGGAAAPAPPRLELPVYFYVGSSEVDLKALPSSGSATTGRAGLNERVEKLQRRGAWFQVRTAAGQEGWVNDRDLKLAPVSDMYVRRGGVRLRAAPEDRGRTIERLRLNDQVKIQEQNNRGWARVTVARTGNNGWLELSNLSVDKVIVRRPVRRPAAGQPAETGTPPAGEPSGETPPPAPAPPSLLTPAPAMAAPPGTTEPQKASPAPPPPRKAKPEMFEPF